MTGAARALFVMHPSSQGWMMKSKPKRFVVIIRPKLEGASQTTIMQLGLYFH